MARPRHFNPDRARGASLFDPVESQAPPGPPGGAKRRRKTGDPAPITVSQVSELISDALVDQLPFSIRVIGQISNLSKRNHWFFSLKDDDAVLQCVAWASRARSFDVKAEDGQSVIATGTVRHFAPQGRTQLYVESLEPIGLGELERRFRELCEQMRNAGYFEPQRKRPLPPYPRCVAVITSASGAAIQDVLSTMAKRSPMVKIIIIDAHVQGDSAPREIVNAMRYVKRHHRSLGIDVVLLTRGGGSLEDLWAFNERAVCDAVFDSPVPTVAAIGHETDTTIAELVADLRCATPTQAAVRIAPDVADLLDRLDHLGRRFDTQIGHHLRLAKQQVRALMARWPWPESMLEGAVNRQRERARMLDSAVLAKLAKFDRDVHLASARLEKQRPERVIIGRQNSVDFAVFRLSSSVLALFEQKMRSLETLSAALARGAGTRVDRSELALRALDRTLSGLDPRSVLARGYSITRRRDGSIVTRTGQVRRGDALRTQLVDGTITSTVDATDTHDNTASVKPGRST